MESIILGLSAYGAAVFLGLTCIPAGTPERRIWWKWIVALGCLEILCCGLVLWNL
jgi:hypothetical protein